jgi:anaerobic ribonucleoside-triphosphate reductase activating protein
LTSKISSPVGAPSQYLAIGATNPHTIAEGPGLRYAIWLQGCSIRCPGCFNPHLWTRRGGRWTDPDQLAVDVVAADVEGVTLLGGEPFDQAPALARFATLVRDAGLSVMTFTGHLRQELERADAPPGAHDLLAATDLLVDGPYLAEVPDHSRPWVGSRNQRFHFLTDRYSRLESKLTDLSDRVEIRVSTSGEVAVNGWATVDQLDTLLAGLSTETSSRLGRPSHPDRGG